MPRVLFAFGTRPEAIKLVPVIKRMQAAPRDFTVSICLTSQHKELLRQVTGLFDLREDVDLDIMTHDQTLEYVTASVVTRMRDVIAAARPDILLIQGDTTTVFAAALAAFYQKVRVGHVEAGLRTGDKFSPYPEEMNRRLAAALTDFHFTPTLRATQNLLREHIPSEAVFQTGNTVVDALQLCLDLLGRKSERERDALLTEAGLAPDFCADLREGRRRLILVTAHRRESFGEPFANMCGAMRDIVDRFADTAIVYPVHPNPNVRRTVSEIIGDHPRIRLIEPVRYEQLVELMHRSTLLLTDSGGIQEEGPSLAKPVLVMREVTERPEGIEAGVSRLVGTGRAAIVADVARLLSDPAAYREMATGKNPYGDGRAAERIADIVRTHVLPAA